jgi:Sulfotransferase family
VRESAHALLMELHAMSTAIVLLFAAERSGTHMLRSMLAGNKNIASPGEVCNAASEAIRTSPISYLKFREDACFIDHDYFYPTVPVQVRLLDEYFALVRQVHASKMLSVLDIKYAHVHNFNAFWWDFISRPLLIDYANQRKIKIIHLVREKPYQTVISDMYAQQSGVWRAREASEIRTMKIKIDPAKLEARTRRLARTIDLFNQWLAGCAAIRVSYEALTADAPATLAGLAAFLGVDEPIPAEPGFLKTTPPYADSIENYDEIAHLIDVDLAGVAPG